MEGDESMRLTSYVPAANIHTLRNRGSHRVFLMIAAIAGIPIAGGCNAFNPPLEVVAKVDLGSYTGRWYEIARYPNSFERGCVGVTADYSLRQDGRINVLNTCREGSLEGNVRTIEGVARVVDSSTNAKLAVTFFGPFEGDYWILELGNDYEYAVVGDPSRKFLWILSREPTLDENLYDDIVSRLPEKGYDPERLEPVLQQLDAE
jgi:apolipoprotein D and lipocalin family protein